MKIIIVGGGASGLTAALVIKKKHPDYQVTLIDKNNKLGKKLRATGNGKANICNKRKITNQYFNMDRAIKLYQSIPVNKLIKFFNDNDIATIDNDDYVYPYSESANMLTDTLINKGIKLGVKYLKETKALDYKNNILITDKGKFSFDKLIIASGLLSSPKLGADASFVINLSKHGYSINNIVPCNCPIKTKESTKEVEGIRRKVNVKLIENNKIYFDEDGEMIFKKDGLSGIVIYNASFAYMKYKLNNPSLNIDFLPNIKLINNNLNAYFHPDLVNYLKRFKNPKCVTYHIKGFYDANDSVASIGGVALDNVDYNFKSKIEDNVYIIGEALDQLGICGGYNLMWAFTSALKVSEIV